MCLVFLLPYSTAIPIQRSKILQSWLEEEFSNKRQILEAFWQQRILRYNQKSVDDFKRTIIANHYPHDPIWNSKIEHLFQDAIDKKINFNLFFNALHDQPFVLIDSMNHAEQLIPEHQYKIIIPHITQVDLSNIKEYIRTKRLSSSITLGTVKDKLITPNFDDNKSQYPFAIHSAGKVFTGILTLIMMEENVISEDELNRPIKLNENVLQKLSTQVKTRLTQVTLHQLMTHQAGIGDYLSQYMLAISEARVPTIKNTKDFLPFLENKVYPIGEFKYSNAGILLVGLAIEHAYENKFHQKFDYNDILNKFIIDKVKMPSFSPWKPSNGLYNRYDPIAPYIVGSPAGGYWVNSHDLAKFGKWIYNKAHSDPKFKRLLEKYGQEFYQADQQLIVHGGGIPSSMAFFSVSLKTGGILAYVSNQPPSVASDLKEMIQRHIFSKKVHSGQYYQ